MEFTIESLQGRIPASVYELLTTEDYMSLPLPEEADIDCAHAVIAPQSNPFCRWTPVNQRAFTQKEVESIESCIVEPSQYGLTMKFKHTDGKVSYIPCSCDFLFIEGQEWNPEDLKLIELRREGDNPIWRITSATRQVKTREYPFVPDEENTMRTQIHNEMMSRYNSLRRRDGKGMNIFKYLRPY